LIDGEEEVKEVKPKRKRRVRPRTAHVSSHAKVPRYLQPIHEKAIKEN